MSLTGGATILWEPHLKGDHVMWRVPRNIRHGDNVVVREGEVAIFLRDGKLLHKLDLPDRYSLSSPNAPVIGPLVKLLTGAQAQAEVFYFQNRVFDGRFGTRQPLVFQDQRFGLVQLRCFGEFRFRLEDPVKFATVFAGTQSSVTALQTEDRIRERVLMILNALLGELKAHGHTVLDVPRNLLNIEQLVLGRTREFFQPHGLEVTELSGLSITLPPEVQKAVDDFTRANVFDGNSLRNLQAYESIKAMRDAAANPTGMAGMGAGLGAGLAAGNAMAQGIANAQAAAPTPESGRKCGQCGAGMTASAKFCSECGARAVSLRFCPECGTSVADGGKFCPGCGTKVAMP